MSQVACHLDFDCTRKRPTADCGKRGLTADTAVRLSPFFNTAPRRWMHMQAHFDPEAMVRRPAMKLAGRP